MLYSPTSRLCNACGLRFSKKRKRDQKLQKMLQDDEVTGTKGGVSVTPSSSFSPSSSVPSSSSSSPTLGRRPRAVSSGESYFTTSAPQLHIPSHSTITSSTRTSPTTPYTASDSVVRQTVSTPSVVSVTRPQQTLRFSENPADGKEVTRGVPRRSVSGPLGTINSLKALLN